MINIIFCEYLWVFFAVDTLIWTCFILNVYYKTGSVRNHQVLNLSDEVCVITRNQLDDKQSWQDLLLYSHYKRFFLLSVNKPLRVNCFVLLKLHVYINYFALPNKLIKCSLPLWSYSWQRDFLIVLWQIICIQL